MADKSSNDKGEKKKKDSGSENNVSVGMLAGSAFMAYKMHFVVEPRIKAENEISPEVFKPKLAFSVNQRLGWLADIGASHHIYNDR